MGGNNTVLVIASIGDAWSALVESLVESHGYQTLHARSFDEASAVLGGVQVDLIIAEQGMEGGRGCEFLAELRTSHPDVLRVLALDGRPGDITRAAIYQFLHLPLDPEQACLVVKRGLEARELSRRHRTLSREFKLSDHGRPEVTQRPQPLPNRMRFENLVYSGEKMAEVCRRAWIAAHTNLPVLIQGEAGTGKTLLAREIHESSPRQSSPLHVQSCAGIPDSLLQGELFGYKRGAFTGALSDRPGLFHAADGGTVVLDEISEASPAFQASLLRFLQGGAIKPLGADHAASSNVRIITTSKRSLKVLVAFGEFRRDLYYRLKGFELELPALRERAADIAPLAELFAARHSEQLRRRTLGISARAFQKLAAYEWPGNIRELENEIRRLVVLTGDGKYITTQHMSPALLATARRPVPSFPWAGHGTLRDQLENLEKHLVQESLDRCRWNQSKAASELGLSRVGLANKIRRYGLANI